MELEEYNAKNSMNIYLRIEPEQFLSTIKLRNEKLKY